jgi:hypothetical protein
LITSNLLITFPINSKELNGMVLWAGSPQVGTCWGKAYKSPLCAASKTVLFLDID